jgi:hypothetical protein
MSQFVQRQISAFCGMGVETDPVEYGVAERSWVQQDVYPAKILKLADGKQENDQFTLAPADGATIKLPQAYDPTKRLFVVVRATETVRITTASAEPASTILLRAGLADVQDGIISFVALGVTSVQVYNPTAVSTVVEAFCYEYPDLTKADSWRDGTQTIGTVSA